MQSHGRLTYAPYHPVLVLLTLGTLAASLVFDIATRFMANGSMALVDVSYRLVGMGILGGLALAAISALDLRKIRHDSPQIDAALMRLAVDLVVVLLFFVNFFWREITAFNLQTTIGQIVLSGVALLALLGAQANVLSQRVTSLGVRSRAQTT